MNTEKESVKVDKTILAKVRKHVKKSKQSIGGFYDLAVLEKIKNDKSNIPPQNIPLLQFKQ